MKRISFSMLAVAGLLLTACSEKDVIVEGGGTQGELLSNGYMALNIDLPTASSSSTRAENDKFDDGNQKEYNVNNCALLLFQGNSESDATLLSVQLFGSDKLTDLTGGDADNDNITNSYKVTTAVSGLNQSKNLYALAILNYDSYLQTKSGNEGGYQLINLSGNNTTVDLTTGSETASKWADIKKYTAAFTLNNLIGSDKNKFLMSNAVMSTAKGGSKATAAPKATDIFQLATLDKAKIYNTASKAEADPAGEILVERAVAKATLSLGSTIENGTTVAGLTIAASGVKWAIDNIEPNTYVFRNLGDNPLYIGYTSGKGTNYRFVGEASTASNTNWGTTEDYYRTYWCIDPQYDSNNMTIPESESEQNSVGMIEATNFYEVGTDNPQYCTENTFDVAHQTYRNTTRAIIEVTFTSDTYKDESNDGEFCIINGNKDVLYTTAVAKTHLIERFTSNAELNALLDENLNDNKTINWANNDFDNIFDYEFERDPNTGVYSMTSLTLKSNVIGEGQLFKTETDISTELDAIRAVVNANLVILQYTGGKMYYEARFMHFASNDDADDLAPWGTWEESAGKTKPSSSNPYPGTEEESAQNYLGRYGMVRNNWYDVEVTAFKKIGSPVNPAGKITKDNTPDDLIEDNMTVKIHVLSWAKRKQSWEF